MNSTQVIQEQIPLFGKVKLTLSLQCQTTGLTRDEVVRGMVLQSKVISLSSPDYDFDIEYKIDVEDSKNFGYSSYTETKLVTRRHNQLTRI